MGVEEGHCWQSVLPLRTYGVGEGQSDVFCVLVIKNRFWAYSSMERVPRTQLFPSKLVMLAKREVSAREAVGVALLEEG